MIDPPQITETAEQQAAVIRLTIPRTEIKRVMGPAMGEVMQAVTAQAVGKKRNVSLLRGHGCVVLGKTLREATFTAIYLEINAAIQLKVMAMGKSEKDIQFLTPGEVAIIEKARAGYTLERGWENWCRRVSRPCSCARRSTSGSSMPLSE